MKHTDVLQFMLYRAPTTYEGLKKGKRDFESGQKFFLAAHMARHSQPLTSKRILQKLEKRQEPEQIEKKVDIIAARLAEPSLLMKKSQKA